jgi:hypothetical protein
MSGMAAHSELLERFKNGRPKRALRPHIFNDPMQCEIRP